MKLIVDESYQVMRNCCTPMTAPDAICIIDILKNGKVHFSCAMRLGGMLLVVLTAALLFFAYDARPPGLASIQIMHKARLKERKLTDDD